VTTLRAGDRTLRFGNGRRPLVMGVLNATPDSFSDARDVRTLDDRLRVAERLLADGADLLDVGGESNVTNRPAIDVLEELERVVPLIARLTSEFGALVSIDTYKAPVAEAAIAAGARIVNDISGLADPALAELCARTGAGYVLMHTPVAPKTQEHREDRFTDAAAEVRDWLAARLQVAREHGLADEQVLLDPGPDFGKTPAQTVEILRGLGRLRELGRPVLLAVSRKDFVGAVTLRRPRERLAGTLAAVGFGADAGGAIFRVHDVREVADYLAVRAVLRGDEAVEPGARVPEHLRREAPTV
jgi:dihydropteroate synthase